MWLSLFVYKHTNYPWKRQVNCRSRINIHGRPCDDKPYDCFFLLNCKKKIKKNFSFCSFSPHLQLFLFWVFFLVPEIIDGNTLTATVVDLNAWVEYEFRVLARNSVGVGEPSPVSVKTRTEDAGTAGASFTSFTARPS